MHLAKLRLCWALGLLAVLTGACAKRDNPEACSPSRPKCPDGYDCNRETLRCEPTDAAPAPRLDAAPAALGTGVDGGEDAAITGDDGGAAPTTDVRPAMADASPDRAVDGPGTCGDEADCPVARPFCVRNQCVQCAMHRDCPAARPICSTAGTCESCAAMGTPMTACRDRDATLPVCAPNGQCVECTASAQCGTPTRPICLPTFSCASCAMAGGDMACRSKANTPPVCNTMSGECVECTQHDQCSDPKKPVCASNKCVACDATGAPANGCMTRYPTTAPVCNPGNGECTECTTSAHCTTPGRPICESNKCVPCVSDDQCVAKGGGPGVCMFHQDGRCASEAETVYVENRTAGCSPGGAGGGTSAMPYCFPQSGIDAALAGAGKRLVLLRGPAGLRNWTLGTAPAQPLTVVGQTSAFINGGPDVGIRVSAGDVYVRGVIVKSGSNVGVVVEGAGTLRLNRCTIESNAGGGIYINQGGFEITNTIIADNGPGDTPGFGFWGGVAYGGGASGRPARFVHNTVYGNRAAGVVCTAAMPTATGNIVAANDTAQASSACAIPTCCSGPPTLSSPYRLTAGSPCLDKVPQAMSVADDIDGDRRPINSASDCGADELR